MPGALLDYNGKTINASNLLQSDEDTVGDLLRGETVPVQLEPGDATRYDLLITPLWLTWPTYIGTRASRYVVVCKIGGVTGVDIVRFSKHTAEYDIDSQGNPHTCRVLAAYVAHLATLAGEED